MDLLQPADVVAVPSTAIPGTGVQTGDRIVKVNGINTPSWESVYTQVEKAAPNSTLSVVVSRAGVEQTFSIPVSHAASATDSGLGFPPVAPVTDEVGPGTPAEKAGMKEGDRIVSIDGTKVVAWQQLVERVRNSDGRSLHFVVQRDGKDVALDIAPIHQMAPPDGQMMWQIGVLPKTDETYEHQGIVQAATDGFSETVALGKLIGSIFTGLFRGRVSVRDLAGPVGIVQMSGQAAKRGPMTLLRWIAYISLDLGLLNLLPIPILDGGHVLLLAIEGTLRRDLSITVKERFVQVGLVFLLGLFAFVMYSDILRLVQRN